MCRAIAGSLCAAEQQADQEAGDEELDRGRDAAASMPTAQSVAGKELATAGPWEPQDVFEVGTGSRERAGHCGIEWPARGGEQQDGTDPGADLEASVGDVLVRHSIPREVKEQSERQRAEPRAEKRTAGCPSRDMKGDDHAATLPARLTRRREPRIL
jgi:hypothetical protein